VRIPIQGSTTYRGRHSRPNWFAYAIFVGLSVAAGALGWIVSPSRSPAAAAWYAALDKPAGVPPTSWLGPIWAALYLLMGTSAWLVWHERYHKRRGAALIAYFIQLLLNAAWAPLFFGTRSVGASLFIAVALWVAIAWTMREFFAVRALSAWMLAPYLGWVGFAMFLNFELWRMNP